MAIKIKKQSNKPSEEELLKKDDQILEASKETYSWLSEHRTLIIALVAGVVVLILAGTWYLDQRREKIAQASAATYEALAETFRPVGEAPQLPEGEEPIPSSEIFDTKRSKLTSVREKATSVVRTYEDRRAGNEARLLAASASLELGDNQKAVEGYQRFQKTSDTRLGELVATLGESSSLAANGDLDKALSKIDGIMGRFGNLRPHLALHKAQLIETYGKPEKALTAYQQILNSKYTLEGIDTDTMKSRIALLKVLTSDTTPQGSSDIANSDDGAIEQNSGDNTEQEQPGQAATDNQAQAAEPSPSKSNTEGNE